VKACESKGVDAEKLVKESQSYMQPAPQQGYYPPSGHGGGYWPSVNDQLGTGLNRPVGGGGYRQLGTGLIGGGGYRQQPQQQGGAYSGGGLGSFLAKALIHSNPITGGLAMGRKLFNTISPHLSQASDSVAGGLANFGHDFKNELLGGPTVQQIGSASPQYHQNMQNRQIENHQRQMTGQPQWQGAPQGNIPSQPVPKRTATNSPSYQPYNQGYGSQNMYRNYYQ
jgi:hypothetical protein